MLAILEVLICVHQIVFIILAVSYVYHALMPNGILKNIMFRMILCTSRIQWVAIKWIIRTRQPYFSSIACENERWSRSPSIEGDDDENILGDHMRKMPLTCKRLFQNKLLTSMWENIAYSFLFLDSRKSYAQFISFCIDDDTKLDRIR